jgi:hypothetical protein
VQRVPGAQGSLVGPRDGADDDSIERQTQPVDERALVAVVSGDGDVSGRREHIRRADRLSGRRAGVDGVARQGGSGELGDLASLDIELDLIDHQPDE